MARSIGEIQAIILAKKEEADQLSALEVLTDNERAGVENLSSSSRVSIWRIWAYITAFAIWSLEVLFDIYKREVDVHIAENEIHNFLWYRKKALDFQYGHALVAEHDYYDNSNLLTADIENSKIVKHVAVVRKIVSGRGFLELKLAKETSGQLVPLEAAEMQAFEAYMFQVADAGTYIEYVSLPHDDLRLNLEIQYDPQVLWNDGSRKDGSNNNPVVEAINNFLYQLEFNGELILTKLTDQLQEVEGVKIPKIRDAAAKYGEFAYSPIDETYIARAGYMRLDLENTNISYVAREV